MKTPSDRLVVSSMLKGLKSLSTETKKAQKTSWRGGLATNRLIQEVIRFNISN